MKKLFAAMALLVATSVPVFGQQPTFQDPLLDHFVGAWSLEGTIGGKQTTHDVTAEWVLGHQYLRIHEISHEIDAKGEPQYESYVFIGWDQPASQYACILMDVFGGISNQAIGHAPRKDDEIALVFGEGATEFHTNLIYDPKSGNWEWKLDAVEPTGLKPFARLKMTKK